MKAPGLFNLGGQQQGGFRILKPPFFIHFSGNKFDLCFVV
jgi:hypothetical protein